MRDIKIENAIANIIDNLNYQDLSKPLFLF